MTENQIPQQPQYAPPMYQQIPAPQLNTSPPEKPKRNFAKVAIMVAAALLIGGAVGAAAKPTVYKAPAACAQGFNYAEDVFSSSSTTMGYMQDALQSAARMDASGIARNIPKVDAETSKLKLIGPKYQSAKEACLGGDGS
jgi:hypothetical protein